MRPNLFWLLLPVLLSSCGGGHSDAATPVQSSLSAHLLRASHCPSAPFALRTVSAAQYGRRGLPEFGERVTLRGTVAGEFQERGQLHGFFLQQPEGGRHANASDGIFVHVARHTTRLTPGQSVQVSGTLTELADHVDDGARLARLDATGSIAICGSSVAPAPRSLRFPIEDVTQLARLEGTLVRVEQALIVSDNHELGHQGLLTLSSDDRLWQPTNQTTPADAITLAEQNRRAQLNLDDASNLVRPSPIPYLDSADQSGTRRVGDGVTHVEGFLTRMFGDWRIEPTVAPLFTARNPRPSDPPQVGGRLRIVSMNVLSYFTTLDQRGAKSAQDLTRQRDKLVSSIVAMRPAALALMEIENGTGALTDLVNAVNARLGAAVYKAVDDTTQGSDEIKVALMYQPDLLVPQGAAVVQPTGSNSSVAARRPSLAQHFIERDGGASFWLVANHLKSKSRCPSAQSFDHDRGQGCWNLTRVSQMRALARWSAELSDSSHDPNVLLVGDFNAYLNEDPIRLLEQAGFEDLIRRQPAAERYSYVYAGQSGALDHAFASDALRGAITATAYWHINADEPSVFDYTSSGKPDDRYAPGPWRASDHDPLLVGITLQPSR